MIKIIKNYIEYNKFKTILRHFIYNYIKLCKTHMIILFI